MAAKNFRKLFEPYTVKSMTLRNRIVMTPIGTNFAEHTGEVNERIIDYYKQRAKGGTGLITIEAASVYSPQGASGSYQLRIDHDNYIPGLYRLCESIHDCGSKISILLNHAGSVANGKMTNIQPVSASDIPSRVGGDIPRALTTDEIYTIVDKFAEAAKRAVTAGFDAVEIQAGHGYLLNQFLSPTTNDRTDEFGGSKENRARFTTLVLKAVRETVGENIPIFLGISADELAEGGNTLDDTLEIVEYFKDYVDVFDVSAGLTCSIQYQYDADYLPDGWKSYMSKSIKEKTGKPCQTSGNIREPEVANRILEDGEADLIAIGRGLIADPHWVKKVATGHEDDIRKCISCNIGCAGNRIGVNRPIRCTVNPTVNSGFDYKKKKVNKPCNVVVIGGGTAGLEAACTAAEVGCTTFLFEKNDHLGGLAVEISKIPDKKRLRDFPDYLVHRASKLTNLFIFKGQEATLPLIKALHPNIIVNSTGSNPLLPPIKGLHDHIDKEGSKVASITGMINHLADYPEDCTGKKVVVVGGGAVGLDVVEYFAPKGAQVSIVEMMPQIGKDLDPVSKCGTNTLMREHNVNQMTETALCEVKADAFTVKANGEEKDLPFDYGFVCLGMRANAPVLDEIREAFADTNVEIINIGDSVRARRIIDGVQEGHNILNVLADHEYL